MLQGLRLACATVPEPGQQFAQARRVDPNRAGLAELMSLPGMGRERAAQVLLWRLRHGPFRRPEDLGRVPGIGVKTLAAWRGLLVFGRK